jgi:hypothetical protein
VLCVAIWSILMLVAALRAAIPAKDAARMIGLIDATA